MMPRERITIRAEQPIPDADVEQIARAAYSVLRCSTCEWAVRPVGDDCAEQDYVLGCIHWRRRAK
jgi:hypothetical protein